MWDERGFLFPLLNGPHPIGFPGMGWCDDAYNWRTLLIMAQVLRKRTAAQPMTIQQYTLTAILFATVATIQEFSGDTLTIIFALEAIVLTWYGIRAQSRYLWVTALGIFGITLVQLNIQVSIGALVGEPVIPIWNMQTLAFYTLAICLGVAAFLFQHSTGISRYIPKSLQLAAIVVLILWTILEFSGFTLTILLALAALALIFYGLQSQGRHLWGAGLTYFESRSSNYGFGFG